MLAARILIALLFALVAIPPASGAWGAADSAALRLNGHANPETSAPAGVAGGGLVGVGARLHIVGELTAAGGVPSLPKTRVWGFRLGLAPCDRGRPELTPSSHWDYRLPYDGIAVGSPLVPRAAGAADDLSRAAGTLDRNNLTRAGRALQKHGDRTGSAFPRVAGSAADRNAAAQAVVDDILTHPQATFTNRTHTVFGEVLEVRASDGRGLRFSSDGSFIGFLEP